MIPLTLNPDGTVSGPGFSPLENLIANHRFQIGIHLLAAKAIHDSGEHEIRKLELGNHACEVNRRYGILSGLLFALGVVRTQKSMRRLQDRLGITEDELNEFAQNAADLKPSFGNSNLN